MKITFILPHLGLYGGIKCTLELANQLCYLGHQVRVFFPLIPNIAFKRWYSPREQIRRVYIFFLNLKRNRNFNWFNVKFDLKRVLFIKDKYIPQGDFIIATWWENVYDISLLSPNKGRKIHYIRSYETWGGLSKLVENVYRIDNLKIVVAKFLKDFFQKYFKITCYGPIPDSIDLSNFYGTKLNKKSNKLRIGTIYSSVKIKGIIDFFKALIIVKRKGYKFQLVLFGNKIKKKHKKILKEFPNYEFHLFPIGSKLNKLYNSLDIYIMASHIEGFPAPPIEAMACKTATILTNVGVVSEYAIHEKNALLIPPKKPDIMAENIIRLIEDNELRENIAHTAYKTIRNKILDWKEISKKLEKLLYDLKEIHVN